MNMKLMEKIKEFFSSSRRIISISQKPSKKEFWLMAKIIGIGIILIGVIGYLIKLIMQTLGF
jgi:protein transport protein SEC61 subunit gamma and related proteins